jgi:Leucine-rich repeat (LRR) protein
MKNLKELYLADNQIDDLNQIDNLKNCKKLEKLVLKDNPITNIINYRQKILEILPQLKKLDDIEVKQSKINNNNNFNSPLAKKDSGQNNINDNYNI